jgi:hypothetical protein
LRTPGIGNEKRLPVKEKSVPVNSGMENESALRKEVKSQVASFSF